jgi:hypothetical protein
MYKITESLHYAAQLHPFLLTHILMEKAACLLAVKLIKDLRNIFFVKSYFGFYALFILCCGVTDIVLSTRTIGY